MELKHRFLASRSTEIGKLSNFPKEVLYHILSRLPIKDLARFCCVSKPCRELSLSTPAVRIYGFAGDEIPDMSACELRLKLVNALDRFLISRGDNKMRIFDLVWEGHSEDEVEEPPCFCVNESFRMITWIQNAVRCKVEKLYLDITFYDYEGERLEFPSCVFRCESLRSLVVEMSFTVVATPSFAFSCNLENLDLRDVDIEDEGFFKWISSSCKLLKKLSLARLNGINNITIESLSLEYFCFINFQVDETCHIHISGEKLEEININCSYSPRSAVLNIVAPNVKCLMLEGNVKNNLNLGELECLQEASILMEPIVDDFDKVFKVLCSLCSVQILSLNEATIKAAYREETMHMHAQLDEIWDLHMNIGSFTDELVPAVVSLLRGTPNLCTLYMSYKPTLLDPKSNTSGFDMGYWKMQELAFISHVEDVTIELSAGSNGIELARYILEHAETLENMVIRYLPHQSNVKRKLKKSKTISKATVTFEEYQSSVDPLG